MEVYTDAYGSEIREFFQGEEFILPSVEEFGDFPSELYMVSHAYNEKNKIASVGYISLNMSIDIETTTVEDVCEELTAPYLFTLCLSVPSSNIFFIYHLRQAERVDEFLKLVHDTYSLGCNDNKTECKKVVCFCHNLSYDFYFLRGYLSLKKRNGNFFAKDKNKCFRAETVHDIDMRDTFALTNCGLVQLSESYTTHKKKKDLNYKEPRNTMTPLTAQEWRYVNEDVIILCEFADEFFSKWCLPNRPLPLTNTSRLLARVKMKADELGYNVEDTKRLQPDLETLKVEQQFLMRGGLVGSNPLHRGEVVDVYMRDITSSYPSIMLTEYFPMSAFKKVKLSRASWYYDDEPDDFIELLKNKCVKMHVIYYNIHAKTEHCFELERKCIHFLPYEDDENGGISDGHIYKGEAVEVLQTELDYNAYKLFYTYELATIESIEIADRGPLPLFFRKCIADDYLKKGELKANGLKNTPDYILKKLDVNTYFGACCKGLYITSVKYKHNEWITEEVSSGALQKDLDSRVLSYYWGVWTSAHGRMKLARMLFKLTNTGATVIYYDTDSLKYIPDRAGRSRSLFEEENKRIREHNKKIELLDNALFYGKPGKGLGEWDAELTDFKGKPIKAQFKTIGPKRYLFYSPEGEDAGWHLCVSGLTKLAAEHLPAKPFEFFDVYGFDFGIEELERLIPVYHPEPYKVTITDNYGNTETIACKSGITLKKPQKHVTQNDIFAAIVIASAEKLERRGFI